MTDSQHDKCPLAAVHIKLDDVHRLWHQTGAEYSSPDGFRVNLNACIQAVRNVTFVLQKNKGRIPDFEDWYASWQDRMKSDPVMRWLVEARNRIVHEGDLETDSRASVQVRAGWNSPVAAVFSVDPLLRTEEIATALDLSELPEPVRRDGLLEVERRWVAHDLPTSELLDALAHAYGVLSQLLDGAHVQCRLPEVETHEANEFGELRSIRIPRDSLGGRLPCMVATRQSRTISLKIATGEIVKVGTTPLHVDRKRLEYAKTRYELPKLLEGREKPRTLRQNVEIWTELATRILERDGYHEEIVTLLLPSGGLKLMQIRPHDRPEKVLMWTEVAAEVERTAAVALIHVVESWLAPLDLAHPNRPASESSDRLEVLSVVGASQEGEYISLYVPFSHATEGIRFGPVEEVSEVSSPYLEPIRSIWKRHRRVTRQ